MAIKPPPSMLGGQPPVLRQQQPMQMSRNIGGEDPASIILKAAGLDRQDAAMQQKASDGLRDALFTVADLAMKKRGQDIQIAQNKAITELRDAQLKLAEQKLDSFSNPYLKTHELQAFGAPAGTRRNDVAGQIPVAPGTRKSIQEIENAVPILDSLETMVDSLDLSDDDSYVTAGVKGLKSKAKSFAPGTAEGQFKTATKNIATVARAMGDKGALSDQDIERILGDMPSFFDTKKSAKARIHRIRGILMRGQENLKKGLSGDILAPRRAGSAGGAPDDYDAELAAIDAELAEE